jgi:hypothetical protein
MKVVQPLFDAAQGRAPVSREMAQLDVGFDSQFRLQLHLTVISYCCTYVDASLPLMSGNLNILV